MINNQKRIGNFTSSEIYNLLSMNGNKPGKAYYTLIAETQMERMLGRSIKKEEDAKPLSWGKQLESHVFNLLGLEYTLTSTETDVHPEIDFWSGSKDGTREGKQKAIIDIKCPFTVKSFCQLVLPMHLGYKDIDAFNCIRSGFEHEHIQYPKHKDGDKYYWQLVSNAIINGCDFAELVVYMPYQKELSDIRQLADGDPSLYWLTYSDDAQLPYLPDNGVLDNLYVLRFEIPHEDKELLTTKIKEAGARLIETKQSTLIATGDQVNGTDIVVVEKA